MYTCGNETRSHLGSYGAAVAFVCPALPQTPSHEWQVYGGNPEGTRYSPLKQIDRSNVDSLKMAWSYDVSDGRGGLQTNPIIVNGVVYGNTPGGKVVALDAASGKLVWSWDSKITGQRVRGIDLVVGRRRPEQFRGVRPLCLCPERRER